MPSTPQRLKDFEKQVIETLIRHLVPPTCLQYLLESTDYSYEYTGRGYYLTIQHPELPVKRTVCDKPHLRGSVGKVDAGFVAFPQDEKLTLECHSWGDNEVPEGFRESSVVLTTISHTVI
jgi:hypothetical protein